MADWLREEILEGRLAPGARLVEAELVLRSGTSRVTLREALRILAQEGLLDISPHRGASVRPLSDQELRELFGVRAAIEAFAAGAAARRRDPVVMGGLRASAQRARAAVEQGDMTGYRRLAADFHEALVAAGDNAILAGMYAQIRARLRRYQAAMSRVPELPQTSIAEHDAILATIATGDAASAMALTTAHLDSLVGQFAAPPKTESTEGRTTA